ncbi:MAG: BrnT family toxin [Bdellovibrionaceae bacterium]|nr:BrnT family toxin [Pseudobdellovibrionaceae bacterium]
MEFEWDERKSVRNFAKHRVRFEEAMTVFADPNYLEFYDDPSSESEDRFIRIGLSAVPRTLVVVYCAKTDDKIRIISARKATIAERKVYEERI